MGGGAYPALLSGQQREQRAAVHLSHQQLRNTKKKHMGASLQPGTNGLLSGQRAGLKEEEGRVKPRQVRHKQEVIHFNS